MEGIKNLVSLYWQDLINLIHFSPSKKGGDDVIKYSKELQKEGLMRIPDFIPTSFADQLRDKVEALSVQNPRTIELENGAKFNYRSQDNPDGPDAGMLDISYVEKLIPEISEIDQNKLVEIVQNVTGQEIIPLRANAYLNNSIKNTRIYHIDNAQPVIYKAFIYLSDVPDTSYGPYSFVKGSQRFSFHTYWNLFLNMFSSDRPSTDMPIYNTSKIVHAIGKKGDLFMSNQNGIHRGLPQKEGRKRIVLVFSFMVRSKLSYIHGAAKENIEKSKAENAIK